MKKTILLTGATDGIGFEAAKRLRSGGHTLLLHGRSEAKLARVASLLSGICDTGVVQTYAADLSQLEEVEALAASVLRDHERVDVLINNAGVFNVAEPLVADGYDIRFVVNTLAPYLLTRRLLAHMSDDGRIINLSSAAQAPVRLSALAGESRLNDSQAYAQSKLALTMWSFHLAQSLGGNGPAVVAVNPGSLLASKMVKDAYGVAGKDLAIGADILFRAALGEEFAAASGKYFDNDQGRFASPHPDALDSEKNERLVAAVDHAIARLLHQDAPEQRAS